MTQLKSHQIGSHGGWAEGCRQLAVCQKGARTEQVNQRQRQSAQGGVERGYKGRCYVKRWSTQTYVCCGHNACAGSAVSMGSHVGVRF